MVFQIVMTLLSLIVLNMYLADANDNVYQTGERFYYIELTKALKRFSNNILSVH